MISRMLPAMAIGAALLHGQSLPAEYESVLKSLGKQGDFKANVLKVNIPRSDLKVTIDGIATPTPFGFGGWIAMTKGDGGQEVMMGDLVLLEDEVNPVMSALLDNGLDVTALHNHFFFESPRVFYMHVHGHGAAADLAKRVKPALDLIGRGSPKHQSTVSGAASNISAGQIDTAKIARLVGQEGEQSGQVYKITIGRDDLNLTEMGAKINARMGLNTWAAFFGSDSNAEIAGDVAMLETEVTPVLKALRSNGLNVVAIHNHMTEGQPVVYFLHYWGTGPTEKLATGFKAALDQLGRKRTGTAQHQADGTVVFVCEHGSAKSVVAAAHFNRIAEHQGLPYHAIARGLSPDSAIPEQISRGLASDGLDVTGWTPAKASEAELMAAVRVVTLSCQLPAKVPRERQIDWTDFPSITENYGAGRDAIVARVRQLAADLAARAE
jgi:protein-tyrosine-phosphatase